VFGIDHTRVAQLLLQTEDASFDLSLLVLRIVVLGVLGDVPEFTGLIVERYSISSLSLWKPSSVRTTSRSISTFLGRFTPGTAP
jgi:hypothetical protein